MRSIGRRILLPAVHYADDLHRIVANAVNQHVVGMDHGFPGSRATAWTFQERKLGQALGIAFDQVEQPVRCIGVELRNVVEDRAELGPGFGFSDESQRFLPDLLAMSLCISAMTSS